MIIAYHSAYNNFETYHCLTWKSYVLQWIMSLWLRIWFPWVWALDLALELRAQNLTFEKWEARCTKSDDKLAVLHNQKHRHKDNRNQRQNSQFNRKMKIKMHKIRVWTNRNTNTKTTEIRDNIINSIEKWKSRCTKSDDKFDVLHKQKHRHKDNRNQRHNSQINRKVKIKMHKMKW